MRPRSIARIAALRPQALLVATHTVYGGVTAWAAFALRRVGDTYTGPLVRVERSSDSAQMDIYAVGGQLDTTTLLNFVGSGNNGWVVTWYDQTGQGNNFVSNSSPPTLVSGGTLVMTNSEPTLSFSSSTYLTAPFTFAGAPFDVTYAGALGAGSFPCTTATKTSGGQSIGLGTAGGGYFDLQRNGQNDVRATTQQQTTFGIVTWESSAGYSGADVNATPYLNSNAAGPLSMNYDGTAIGSTTYLGASAISGDYFAADLSEIVYYPLSASRAAIEQNLGANHNVPSYVTPTATEAHQFWGIRINSGYGNPYALSELSFAANSTATAFATTAGTAFADSSYGGSYSPSSAFDSNLSTCWASSNPTAGTKLYYRFLNAVEVGTVSLTARNDSYYDQAPEAFDVIFSDDGVNWFTAWSDTYPAPSQGLVFTTNLPS